MPTVAYLINQFPSPVEPYVIDEIQELRRRGVEVIPCSARQAGSSLDEQLNTLKAGTIYLQPIRFVLGLQALWLCFVKRPLLLDLIARVLVRGGESPARRGRALIHTWLGAYYALRLGRHGVEHIHVHHGYFSAWIALVASRLLGIGFSMTLHGSDLLLHATYLDTKLKHCKFCITISEFNRRHILEHYAEVEAEKILLQRMGVEPRWPSEAVPYSAGTGHFIMLAVGRLHAVKDHAFLIRACVQLKERGIPFQCLIAGEGPERPASERLIAEFDLRSEVHLLGHLSQRQIDTCYAVCDLVVLTSRSEGIPLVLMEAMVRGRTVLGPAITGIPELVIDRETGFLYRAGSLPDFVDRVADIVTININSQLTLQPVRLAARQRVLKYFNREINLPAFADTFMSGIAGTEEKHSNENFVLQQI